jgi:MFS family permease
MLAYIVSYADRTILSLLIEPIKADLDLSDVQISLLLGPAFGIFYTTLGLPLGWLADRRSRRGIIAVGITLWCAMTAASGLARNFVQLFLARIGVGVGEATLSPAALSLISDYFPRDKALRAIGFYFMAQSLGGGLAYLVGGQVVVSVAAASTILVPLVGELKAWQVTFLVVGLPGLLLALLMLTVKEPLRRGHAGTAGAMPVGQVVAFLRERWRAYGALFVGNSAVTIQGYAYFWLPVLFERRWGWDVGTFGLYFGIVLAVCGVGGILAGSQLSAVLYRRGYIDAPYRTTVLGLLITIPAATLMPLMPSGEAALALMVPAIAGVSVASASGAAAVVHIAPAELRAQASAGYFLVINVLGLFLGPTSVAVMTDYVFKSEQAIHLSLAMVPGILGSTCLLVLLTGLTGYRRCAREADTWHSD